MISTLLALTVATPALAAVTVKKGDTLYNISQRNGVSVPRLRALNNLKGDFLKVGQVLKVGAPTPRAPVAVKPAAKTVAVKTVPVKKVPMKTASAKPLQAAKYTVRSGDTLNKIAGRGQISVATLQRANKLSGTLIRVGQVLKVPSPGSQVATVPSLPPSMEARTIYTYRTVGVHDTFVTLSAVAERNAKLSPAQFMAMNKLSAPWVYPGMKVLLPVRVPVPIPPAPQHPPITLTATRVLGISVQVIKVDLRHRDVLVSPVLPQQGIGSSARVNTLAKLSGAAAVINGSYFHPRSYIPAGDLVVQGKRVSWGRIPVALSITPDNRAHIGTSGGSWAGAETVVASGPQIVVGGVVQTNAGYSAVFRDPGLFRRASRSAIGLSSNRDLMLVSTLTPLTTTEMGKVMARLGAREALLLDGGSSTGLSWNNRPILPSIRSVSYGIGIFVDYAGRRYSRS